MTITNTLNEVAQAFPWELLIAGGVLSPIAAVTIKTFNAQKDITKLGIVVACGLVLAAAQYVISTPTSGPAVIFRNGALAALFAQPYWYLVVKPASVWLGNKVAQGVTLDKDLKSALEPAGGLKVAPVQNIEVTKFE
jgi:hypothetical protein